MTPAGVFEFMLKKCFILFWMLSLFISAAHADVGTVMFPFLRQTPAAFCFAEDDVTMQSYNPASLAALSGRQVSFTHLQYWQDITWEFFNLGFNVTKNLNMGVYVNQLNYGKIERTVETASGELAALNSGAYSAADSAAGIYMARMFGNCGAGLGIKFVKSQIDNQTNTGVCADFGLTFTAEEDPGKTTLVIQNVGSADKSLSMPMTARFGRSMPLSWFTDNDVIITVDFVSNTETSDKIKINTGIEYNIKQSVFLRLGYMAGHDVNKLSAGIGLRKMQKDGRSMIELDYAVVPSDRFGPAHWFTIRMK
jgi:hypothetical protein